MTSKPNSGQHETELDITATDPASPALDGVVKDERVDAALGIFSDLKSLEVTPTTSVGAREILGTIAVRKPKNNEFIRVSVKPENSLTTVLFEDKDEGVTYLVAPHIRPLMIAGAVVKMLVLAVNQAGVPFIWPVPVDDQQSRRNAWNESARVAYHKAKTHWVKLVGDRAAGQYRLYIAEGKLPDPRWPDRPFSELLAIGFRNLTIDSEDHAIIRAMLGLTV